jgi:hypothetical protein
MESKKRRELVCGDAMNSLSHESREFQWSVAYKWYSEISPEENLTIKCGNPG